MKIAVIYPQKFDWCFKLWSECIADCFKQLGFITEIAHEINKTDADIEVIQGYLAYGTFEKKKNKSYVMIQGEQFPTDQCNSNWQIQKWERTKTLLPCYDYVWDTYLSFHEKLYKNFAVKTSEYKLGYHEYFDKCDKSIVKDIDVSFFGSPNERRNKILKNIPNIQFFSSINDPERARLINSSKINLNLHYDESKLFQTLRVLMFCMSSKAFVVTEEFIGEEDILNGTHLVQCKREDMKEIVQYFLNHPEERNRIAETGYEYLKNKRTMVSGIKHCLNCLGV